MATDREENLIFFPFMAQGHLIPFLALALQIEKRTGYTVTLVNTPLNIKKLQSLLPPKTTIRLVELAFCGTDHGLPPNLESADKLPSPLLAIRLLEASRSLESSLRNLISEITDRQHGHPPLCIIADMFLCWTVEMAKDLGIAHTVFVTSGAYGTAIYSSIWSQFPHICTHSDEFSLSDFPEVSRLHCSQLDSLFQNVESTNPLIVFLQKELSLWLKSDGVLVNTIKEIDSTGLNYFRRKIGPTVWPIGPIHSFLTNQAQEDCKEGKICPLDPCIEWLNTHHANSVLYISFGSQNSLTSSQMKNLALGLESSGKNFIWVVKAPIEFNINEEFRSEWSPDGFEDRMKEHKRGFLVHKWAPQLEILSHKSTCAILSHCGWNSILESLSHGIPIIGWPLSAEQFYNVKQIEEEMGVGIEVARGHCCEIGHEDIAKVIEMVMGETEKGKEMRRKALEIKEIMKDAIRNDEGNKGSSMEAMDEFINTAFTLRQRESFLESLFANVLVCCKGRDFSKTN